MWLAKPVVRLAEMFTALAKAILPSRTETKASGGIGSSHNAEKKSGRTYWTLDLGAE